MNGSSAGPGRYDGSGSRPCHHPAATVPANRNARDRWASWAADRDGTYHPGRSREAVLTTVRWSDAKSVQLGVREAGDTVLTVWMSEDHRLPEAFLKPRWVRRSMDGAIRIRAAWPAPGTGTAPLADTVRSFTTRHDVPVTATHDES
jgi:hypothetical protein